MIDCVILVNMRAQIQVIDHLIVIVQLRHYKSSYHMEADSILAKVVCRAAPA